MGKALRRRERVVNLNQPALPGRARRQPPVLRAHVPLSSGRQSRCTRQLGDGRQGVKE